MELTYGILKKNTKISIRKKKISVDLKDKKQNRFQSGLGPKQNTKMHMCVCEREREQSSS